MRYRKVREINDAVLLGLAVATFLLPSPVWIVAPVFGLLGVILWSVERRLVSAVQRNRGLRPDPS